MSKTKTSRGDFRSARPFPHVVFDGFLEADLLARLKAEFPPFDAGRARNEIGQVGGKAVHENFPELGPACREFDAMIRSREFLLWLNKTTGIPDLLYDPAYTGGGTHLNLNGQDLDPHVDFNYHPRTRLHRRLNLILFLNDEWDPSWGGNLELGPEEERAVVTPASNRCVIFETSERSWHGFTRIAMPDEVAHLGRRTVAVYFYSKRRPREETAPAHSTFYLPRPLHDRFEAGYTLTAEDAHELRVAVARRDSQIRFLYDRELEFGRMLISPTFRLARALMWPLRAAKGLFARRQSAR